MDMRRIPSPPSTPYGFNTFANELYLFFRYLVDEKRMLQKDICKEISISQASLSHFINGVLTSRKEPIPCVLKRSLSYFSLEKSIFNIPISKNLDEAIQSLQKKEEYYSSSSSIILIKEENNKVEKVVENQIENYIKECNEIVNFKIDNSKDPIEKNEFILKKIEELIELLSTMKADLISKTS